MIELWAMVGVIFAACSVVGNDAVQTLGTFIASNKKITVKSIKIINKSCLFIIVVFHHY